MSPLGLLLHGWVLLRRIFLVFIEITHCPLVNSHLITQARTSFLVHQRLIERVCSVEPTLSRYFSTSLFRSPLITSKHDYFYLVDRAVVRTCKSGQRWVCHCHRRQQQALGDMGAWELSVWLLSDGAQLSSLHQSPICECSLSGSPALHCWLTGLWTLNSGHFPSMTSVVCVFGSWYQYQTWIMLIANYFTPYVIPLK